MFSTGVPRAGVFAQGRAERGVADLAVGGEPGRIAGEKGERPERLREPATASLRLRSERPRVTRLSRKVLAGGAAAALIAVSGAVFWALQNNRSRTAPEELYSTDHRTTADGLAGLP